MSIFSKTPHLLAALLMLPCASVFAEESTDYPINFEKSQTYTHASRKLNGLALQSADGSQSASIDNPQTVYTSLMDQTFSAQAGETVTATFNYSGNWMHGYVYLDQGRDGNFEAALNADGTYESTSDLVAFSYATPDGSESGYNSKGETVSNKNVLQPPSFTIPANLPNGYYRMRYKVDWSSIDPGGRMTADNDILTNGGAICDIRLNVHDDLCKLSITNNAGGGSLALNGEVLTETEVPFGKALTFEVIPEEDNILEAIIIKHGHNLDGAQYIHGTEQYREDIIPGYLARDGKITLPAQYIDGEVRIETSFFKTESFVKYDNYTWPGSDRIFSASELETAGNIVKRISATATKGGDSEISIDETLLAHSHRNLIDGKEISIVPGDTVSVSIFDKNNVELQGSDKQMYLYIDLNQDGHFGHLFTDKNGKPILTSEGVGHGGRSNVITFAIHELMPYGKYRARLVVGDETVEGNCATATDFLINVHPQALKLSVFSTNGSVHGNDVDGLPLTLTYGVEQILRPEPVTARNYKSDGMRIRHGHNLDGEQFIKGNKQWSEYTVDAKTAHTMPGDSVDGEVRVYVDYIHTGSGYTLVFSDEFNAEDGTQPDADKWMRCPRYSSTWNRYLSINDEEHAATGYIEDGKFVALAIPNPFKDTDDVEMITAGIKTMGKFGFTYGKVECRAKSYPWKGNFPAIWLMPEDQSAGWPNCGEIDIWEFIDAQNTSYHTVHSNWTYNLGNKNNPKSSYNKAVSQETWHTYGLVWNETSLTWYVDGIEVGSYEKSTSEDALSKGQWPFDKHYHVILNQSVGNGTWAAWADTSHTYRTEFDWVRVYQLSGQTNTTGIEEVVSNREWSEKNIEDKGIYDLSGRRLVKEATGSPETHNLPAGIYIVKGKKVVVK